MTADWCVTCKANERRTLSSAVFQDALLRADATYMVGDWTNVDPEISAFLAVHRAVGVPLYVVYPRDGGPGEVLPAVLDRSRTGRDRTGGTLMRTRTVVLAALAARCGIVAACREARAHCCAPSSGSARSGAMTAVAPPAP